ncbi:hypothetical protein Tco_1375491 [Tanacetum coccineum]
MKDKVEYKGKNIVGAFMNVPIFVRNFTIVIDFAVVENMDAYRDDGIGDIIAGRPFCKEACPLLKVSAQDELKGISHPYQKLKGFYKEVLNLGLEYIKNEKVEERLLYVDTRQPGMYFLIFIESVFPDSRYGVSNLNGYGVSNLNGYGVLTV